MRRARDSSLVLAVMLAIALGVTTTGLLLAFREAEPARRAPDALGPAPPPSPTGAFARGGPPERGSPAVREVFAEALPGYVIAVDRWAKQGSPDDSVVERARAQVLAPEAMAGLSAGIADRLAALLDRVREAASAPEPVLDRAADALGVAAIELNDQLAAAGLGYVVDPDVITSGYQRAVLVFAFSVERVRLHRSGSNTVRVLHIRRLDTLGWTYNLLGFTTPERREALLLVEQVDERVVDRVLPLMAADPDDFFELSEADRSAPWYPRLASRVVEAMHTEYGTASDLDGVRSLSDLLARRKRLFADWNRRLARREMSLSLPDRLILDWDFRGTLAGLIPADELADLSRIEAALSEERNRAVFDAARARMIRSVERHEVQHRLDHSGPAPLSMPHALFQFVGPPRDPAGDERPGATRAQAELSAYLSELARDPDTPRVGLSFLTEFLIAPEHWGSAECYAAVVIYEGLIRQMNLPGSRSVVSGHEVNRARVVEVFELLVAAQPRDLRAAAAALWAELFGGPLPPLELLR